MTSRQWREQQWWLGAAPKVPSTPADPIHATLAKHIGPIVVRSMSTHLSQTL